MRGPLHERTSGRRPPDGRGWRALLLAGLVCALAACGGGNSTETTLIGGGVDGSANGPEVALTEPSGDNTTEVVVDAGPAGGFTLGVANMPYVTVTLCEPGSATRCVTIDHVFVDTGSIGLRVLRSAVAGLALPAEQVNGANLLECYPFVIGAVWGGVARADLRIAGERAASLPIQLIDDRSPAAPAPPADCQQAANGSLMQSVGSLQARGVLGIGLLRHDCGLTCQMGSYAGSVVLYYACGAAGCSPSAVPPASQVQQPVTFFETNHNGTLMVLPAVPDAGASRVRGRLVFGIGTQANNQLTAQTTVLRPDPDPSHDGYLYVTTSMGGRDFPNSYIDSGSNGFFFDDPLSMPGCGGVGAGDAAGAWYCPGTAQVRRADVVDVGGTRAPVSFSVANANALFSTANTAFGNLGGSAGSANPGAFVWGLSFFYGRTVYTAIWGQPLAADGPWYGF